MNVAWSIADIQLEHLESSGILCASHKRNWKQRISSLLPLSQVERENLQVLLTEFTCTPNSILRQACSICTPTCTEFKTSVSFWSLRVLLPTCPGRMNVPVSFRLRCDVANTCLSVCLRQTCRRLYSPDSALTHEHSKIEKEKLNVLTQNVPNEANVSLYFPFQIISRQHSQIWSLSFESSYRYNM
jgi:hypothetical protein